MRSTGTIGGVIRWIREAGAGEFSPKPGESGGGGETSRDREPSSSALSDMLSSFRGLQLHSLLAAYRRTGVWTHSLHLRTKLSFV